MPNVHQPPNSCPPPMHAALAGRASRNGLRRVLWAALVFVALQAGPSVWSEEQPFPIRFEAPDELAPAVQRLAAVQHRALASVLEAAGLKHPGSEIRVQLVPETSPLARRTPPWILGYAAGDLGVIVLFVERIPAYPHRSLEAVFVHELTHILVSRASGGRSLPRWFEEGFAMHVADPWDLEDRARLVMAMVGDREVTRHELDALFEAGPADARRAYVLSAALVRSMVGEWGRDVPAALLRLVAGGLSFPEAFARVTSTTLDSFEERFWSDQRWWNRWVPLLTSSTLLWAAMTLLVVYAYRTRRRQASAIRRRWELEGDGDRPGDR